MERDVQLVRDLVAASPGFEGLFDAHVFNEDGVLPHVFFWDVVQETVASFLGEGEKGRRTGESRCDSWKSNFDSMCLK
ncbi:hypothetical protein AB0D09_36660 [Streptomyces sp. NPDC049097]|uniref:hypothetical protein n=1 Tax=Streptomyces sp. NPDC049097 TaxID=3155497 RepID=UPI00342543AB